MAGSELSKAYAQLEAVSQIILARLDMEASERKRDDRAAIFPCAGLREDLREALRAVAQA